MSRKVKNKNIDLKKTGVTSQEITQFLLRFDRDLNDEGLPNFLRNDIKTL